ncbi:prepilin peptidase [Candidatus Pacearchaeota archaeon]|nr:prepilin peptidase [Candidatus Pacearchaeota archaeon]
MERYYFLFFFALIWCIFASVNDIKKREIANWITYSFIIFALAYRAFYSVVEKDGGRFFLWGVGGFLIFLILAHLFYYSRAFAGGDAKLLMGFGVILPFEEFWDLLFLSAGFIFLLFFIGAIYSLFYSFFLVYKNWSKFNKSFSYYQRKYNKLLILVLILLLILLIIFLINGFAISDLVIPTILLFLLTTIFIYLKAVEKSCLIVLLNPRKLTEGDWLERDIRIKGRVIKKSVHGLSAEEIKILKRYGRNVWIKQGVPFAPAFLISILIFGISYLYSIGLNDLYSLISG